MSEIVWESRYFAKIYEDLNVMLANLRLFDL